MLGLPAPALRLSTPVDRSRLLLPIFAVSGFTSLAYEIAWQKVLSQLIGLDAYSVTLTVSIFMLGLGLGGLAGGQVTRWRLDPLWTYIGIEIALGVFGFFSVPMLRQLNAAFPVAWRGYLG